VHPAQGADLHQWTVWHKIDETSPLRGKEDLLVEMRVQLSVFDTVANAEVRLHHRSRRPRFKRG
jgi:hypothetical protein